MANNKQNIQLSSRNFICKETIITLSDVNLKTILSNAYEVAVENCKKKRFCNYYQIPLSASATLFLSLINSQYNEILGISSETLKMGVVVFAFFLLVLGISMFFAYYERNSKTELQMRDDSVNQIMKSLIETDEE